MYKISQNYTDLSCLNSKPTQQEHYRLIALEKALNHTHTHTHYIYIKCVCCVVVCAFAHGAMGRRIDPSWGGPIALFLVPASDPRVV